MAYTDLRQQQDALSALVAAPSSQQRTIEENKLATQKALSEQALEPARLKEQERIYAGREKSDALKEAMKGATLDIKTPQQEGVVSPLIAYKATRDSSYNDFLGMQQEVKQHLLDLKNEEKIVNELSSSDPTKEHRMNNLRLKEEHLERLRDKMHQHGLDLLDKDTAKSLSIFNAPEEDRGQAYEAGKASFLQEKSDSFDIEAEKGAIPLVKGLDKTDPRYQKIRDQFVESQLSNSPFKFDAYGPEAQRALSEQIMANTKARDSLNLMRLQDMERQRAKALEIQQKSAEARALKEDRANATKQKTEVTALVNQTDRDIRNTNSNINSAKDRIRKSEASLLLADESTKEEIKTAIEKDREAISGWESDLESLKEQKKNYQELYPEYTQAKHPEKKPDFTQQVFTKVDTLGDNDYMAPQEVLIKAKVSSWKDLVKKVSKDHPNESYDQIIQDMIANGILSPKQASYGKIKRGE